MEIHLDSLDAIERLNGDDFSLPASLWHGRHVGLRDFSDLFLQTPKKIMRHIFSKPAQGDQPFFKFAWIGGYASQRLLIKKQIAYFSYERKEWEIFEVVFSKSHNNARKEIKTLASDIRYKTCKFAEKTGGALAEFREKHKKGILIGEAFAADVVCKNGYRANPSTEGWEAFLDSIAGNRHGQKLARNRAEGFRLQYPFCKSANVPDPFFLNPPQTSFPVSWNYDFIRWFGAKFGQARYPKCTESFERPDYIKEFVHYIESALSKTQDIEKYKRELWEQSHDFIKGNQAIAAFFERTKRFIQIDSSLNKYASTLALNKPPAPIAEIPLLGYPNQSTVHYHCGIGNHYASVVEGGLCLGNSLNDQFSVQPHLIHSNHLVAGLSLVQIEKMDDFLKSIAASGAFLAQSLKWPDTDISWPKTILQHSHIQRSIDYEVETLRRISQKILEIGNPNLKQAHVTFSNGGYVFREALKKLTPDERSTIIVITAGTTSIIDDELACVVYNIIGEKDWPSIMCNGGRSAVEAAKMKATLEIVPQSKTKTILGGHYFAQPDYQDKIAEVIKDKIKMKYEIY